MYALNARVRNKCIDLNSDPFINHIRNNPLCYLRNVIEDAHHYVFQCRKYSVEDKLSMIQLQVFFSYW